MDAFPEKHPMQADPVAALSRREARTALYDELAQLPARYQTPVILCDLEGHTNAEAAQRLGCPEGTLKSRLARGRELLRRRLVRRGLTLSGVGLAVLLSRCGACAAVPPELVRGTTQAALTFTTGAGAGAASAAALALAEEALGGIIMSKLKLVLLAALTAGLL